MFAFLALLPCEVTATRWPRVGDDPRDPFDGVTAQEAWCHVAHLGLPPPRFPGPGSHGKEDRGAWSPRVRVLPIGPYAHMGYDAPQCGGVGSTQGISSRDSICGFAAQVDRCCFTAHRISPQCGRVGPTQGFRSRDSIVGGAAQVERYCSTAHQGRPPHRSPRFVSQGGEVWGAWGSPVKVACLGAAAHARHGRRCAGVCARGCTGLRGCGGQRLRRSGAPGGFCFGRPRRRGDPAGV